MVSVRNAAGPGSPNVLSNTGWILAERVGRIGCVSLVSVCLARYFGPVEFGIYTYAIAIAGLLNAIAALGLEQVVIRDLTRAPAMVATTIGSALTIRLGMACFLFAALVLYHLLGGDATGGYPRVTEVIAAGAVCQSIETVELWFYAQMQARATVVLRLACYTATSIATIVLILTRAPLLAFAWCAFANNAVPALGILVLFRGQGFPLTTLRPRWPTAHALLRSCWPLALSTLCVIVYMRFDQVLVGRLVGLAEVGIYAAATRLSEAWQFIPVAIVQALLPSVLRAKQLGEDVYYERLQRIFTLMVVLAYAVAIPATLCNQWLVTTVFGEQYRAAGTILAIHVWGSLFVALGTARGMWSTAEGRFRFTLLATVLGGIASLVLNLLLIPVYGGAGAAAAAVISALIAGCLASVLCSGGLRVLVMQLRAITLRGAGTALLTILAARVLSRTPKVLGAVPAERGNGA